MDFIGFPMTPYAARNKLLSVKISQQTFFALEI